MTFLGLLSNDSSTDIDIWFKILSTGCDINLFLDFFCRNEKNVLDYASVLTEVFQSLFANSQGNSKPSFSSFELNSYLEKISDWLTNGSFNTEGITEDKFMV